MIATELEASREIANWLRASLAASPVPTDALEPCAHLLETVASDRFPGALVPIVTDEGLFIIAVALPSDWRRLSPVLRAFAGPTLTSFDGLPSADLPFSDLAAAIAGSGPHVTATIRLPAAPAGREMALRALVRVRDTFARSPHLTRAVPEPTSWLLARFQDHLNLGRREAAAAILDELRDELRLDALNLRSLQVQLLATFEDWAAIVELPGFANLTLARRTPATTALLLEALYQTHLGAEFDNGRKQVERQYADGLRSLAAPLLAMPLPAGLRTGGWRLAALEALVSTEREDLRAAAGAHSDRIGWLSPLLARTESAEGEPAPEPQPELSPAPADQARDLLAMNDAVESVDAMAAALSALARLTQAQRAEIAQAEPFRSALRALERESGGAEVPTSWTQWLARAADPGFTNALDLARFGAEEWPIAGAATDPVDVVAFLDGLNAAQADPIAAQRTAQALPYLVAALRHDPAFPSPAAALIYASLLTLIALGSTRGASVYESSLVLVDALLSVGTDMQQYQALVSDVDEIVGEGFGVGMVYWTLELVESFMRAAAPAPAAREQLVHKILARLTPIQGRLSPLQQAAIGSLSDEFGWALPVLRVQSAQATTLAERMRGKSIAIYSLVEAASRQAKAAIEAISDGVEVNCSADHGGTAPLRALTVNSDLFVIAWAAAKHAATDFIRAHRGDRPLVYAEGKGVSSLLRAVEDHFSGRYKTNVGNTLPADSQHG